MAIFELPWPPSFGTASNINCSVKTGGIQSPIFGNNYSSANALTTRPWPPLRKGDCQVYMFQAAKETKLEHRVYRGQKYPIILSKTTQFCHFLGSNPNRGQSL